jgi:hypothetical protein
MVRDETTGKYKEKLDNCVEAYVVPEFHPHIMAVWRESLA